MLCCVNVLIGTDVLVLDSLCDALGVIVVVVVFCFFFFCFLLLFCWFLFGVEAFLLFFL